MKKVFITVLLILSILICGCGADYVFGKGAVIFEGTVGGHENSIFIYPTFRGTYTFEKEFNEKTDVKFSCDTEDGEISIYVYDSNDTLVYSRESINITNSGTTNYEFESGSYVFTFTSDLHKGSLTFTYGE